MDYMLKRWSHLPGSQDGRICLTNNAALRALRGVALGRKAWLSSAPIAVVTGPSVDMGDQEGWGIGHMEIDRPRPRAEGCAIFGRNWLGHASRRSWVRALTPMADRVLRPFPCSAGHSLGAQMSFPSSHGARIVYISVRVFCRTRGSYGAGIGDNCVRRRLLSSRTTPPSRKPCHIMT